MTEKIIETPDDIQKKELEKATAMRALSVMENAAREMLAGNGTFETVGMVFGPAMTYYNELQPVHHDLLNQIVELDIGDQQAAQFVGHFKNQFALRKENAAKKRKPVEAVVLA